MVPFLCFKVAYIPNRSLLQSLDHLKPNTTYRVSQKKFIRKDIFYIYRLQDKHSTHVIDFHDCLFAGLFRVVNTKIL